MQEVQCRFLWVHCVWRSANCMRVAIADWGEGDTNRCAHTYCLAPHLFPRQRIGRMASNDDHAIILINIYSLRHCFVGNRVAEQSNRGTDEASTRE
jgi:hypothetical protein